MGQQIALNITVFVVVVAVLTSWVCLPSVRQRFYHN